MAGLTLPLESITRETFAPFGQVIAFPAHPEDERFQVVVREETQPWRIAVFRVRQHEAERLECHSGSMESFEPLGGTGVLLAAEPQSPEHMRAFLLDKPVCLHRGVWHEVIALSDEANYKITENKEVASEFYSLPAPARCAILL